MQQPDGRDAMPLKMRHAARGEKPRVGREP